MKDGADNEPGMDLQQASAILLETQARAKRALVVRRPVLLAVWGAAWIVSDGVIWLSVRTQRPYSGPTPAALAVLGVYGAAAPIVLVALIIAASAAVFLDWSLLGLGIWLLAVAAGSGFAGPVTVWAVSALAGGGALLVMAAIGLRWGRS
jgi:hypothetical protein